jgi:hypothetical protein
MRYYLGQGLYDTLEASRWRYGWERYSSLDKAFRHGLDGSAITNDMNNYIMPSVQTGYTICFLESNASRPNPRYMPVYPCRCNQRQ